MFRKLIIGFLLIFFVTGCSQAGEVQNEMKAIEPSEKAITPYSFDDIQTLSPACKIRYIPGTKTVMEIEGTFNKENITDFSQALTFLMRFSDVMEIEEGSFCAVEYDDSRSEINRYILQQLYQGIPVYGTSFEIQVDKEGIPQGINGIYQTGISVNTSAEITAQEGMETLETKTRDNITESSKVIYRDQNGEDHLAWKYAATKGPLSEQAFVFVDAHSSVLLDQISMVIS